MPSGLWIRMSVYIKFVEKVPPRSGNFGFKIQGAIHNAWVDKCKPNEWTYVTASGRSRVSFLNMLGLCIVVKRNGCYITLKHMAESITIQF